MDTSFNNNQNLSASGNDCEAVQAFPHLEQSPETIEARLRSLLETLPQIVGLAQVDGTITHFNQSWYEYTGLTSVKSLGWEFLKAIHPEDRDRLVASCNLSLKKTKSYTIECRILGKDRTYRWFIGQQTPVIGADGQVLEWVGTYTPKAQLEQDSTDSKQDSADVSTVERKSSKRRVKLTPELATSNQQSTNLRLSKQAAHKTGGIPQHHKTNVASKLSQAIVWEADATTEQFTFVSQSAERILGYPVEQWLSEPNFWINLIHPEDRQWTVALCRKKISQRRDYEIEYRCLTADHRVVWLRDRACVIRNDQGQIHKRRGLMVDITLAKHVEAELQVRSRQQAIITQLTQATLLGTEVSRLMHEGVSLVSQALAVEYCKVLELLPDENALQIRAGVGWQSELVGQATIEASDNTQAGYTLISRQPVIVEDLRRETRFQGSPLLHEHNIISGLSVVIDATPETANRDNDISGATPCYHPFGVLGAHTSKRRTFSRSEVDFLQSVANVLAAAIKYQQAKEALDEAKAQLNQTASALDKRNHELDQFAYVASHDLKAPLRAIANLSQWLEEDISDQLSEDNLHQLQLMRGRVHRLDALINGLLQYSRAGRITSPPQQVDVAACLRQVIDTLNPPPEFTIEVAPEMPTLVTEQSPLQQVFTHLIDNAIKHHPRTDGTVRISVEEQSDAYAFTVLDDGAGIAPRFHERVFVIFQTLQARDKVENTGVGLAIVKRIVESRGGTIRLESEEGQGARFCFTWLKRSSETC